MWILLGIIAVVVVVWSAMSASKPPELNKSSTWSGEQNAEYFRLCNIPREKRTPAEQARLAELMRDVD